MWTDGPDGQNLMFPETMSTAAVLRGVDRARVRGRAIVGAWLSLDTDAKPLADTGFERGWSPWWMTADLSDWRPAADPRIELERHLADGDDDDGHYGDPVALTSQRPTRAWYAAAYTPDSRRFAGRGWAFLDADLAGIFDMGVWPEFQRQRYATGLLNTLCAAARDAGAKHAVLNATWEGKQLYLSRGFTQIGESITWWRHLGKE